MPQKKSREKSQCHIHDNVLNHIANEVRQNVCVSELDFPLTQHTDGKYYCLFHLPVLTKNCDKFNETFQKKLTSIDEIINQTDIPLNEKKDRIKTKILYDFRYVWFPIKIDLSNYNFKGDADFKNAVFSSAIDFSKTLFSGSTDFSFTTFSAKANFVSAKFSRNDCNFELSNFTNDLDFSLAEFSGKVNFSEATFCTKVNFESAKLLNKVSFSKAKFLETSQVFFRYSEFYGFTDFNNTVFAGYLTFEGHEENLVFKNSQLDFQNARLDKPERISFYRVELSPAWFVNVDSRKIIFTDINWINLHKQFRDKSLKANLENIIERGIKKPNSLLEITCRQLAVNAEENNRYDEALSFRKMANESKRFAEYKGFKVFSLHWWYWFSSFYGESWKRAAGVLLAILLGFAWLYTQTDFQSCPNTRPISTSLSECEVTPEKCKCSYGGLSQMDAITHSIATALFQSVEYRKPLTIWGEFFSYLEKILAPLQAALLALAVRRKFMR